MKGGTLERAAAQKESFLSEFMGRGRAGNTEPTWDYAHLRALKPSRQAERRNTAGSKGGQKLTEQKIHDRIVK